MTIKSDDPRLKEYCKKTVLKREGRPDEVLKSLAEVIKTDSKMTVLLQTGSVLVLQDQDGFTWSLQLKDSFSRIRELEEKNAGIKNLNFGLIYGTPHDEGALRETSRLLEMMRIEIDALRTQGRVQLINRAQVFATIWHGDQKYGKKTDIPYAYHLQEVVDTLLKFGVTAEKDPHLHAAAWLHDVVEDTDATIQDIKDDFGYHIGDLVDLVTNPKGMKNRKEKHAVVYPKIKGKMTATALKLADRIANVTESIDGPAKEPGLFRMYKDEYPEFREALYVDFARRVGDMRMPTRPGDLAWSIEEMWKELDRLLISK